MALAFGPDETQLPPYSRSSFAEVQPLQCSNFLQSSTRSTLGLDHSGCRLYFRVVQVSKGRLSLSLPQFAKSLFLPSLLPVNQPTVLDPEGGKLERDPSLALNRRQEDSWGKKIFRQGNPASRAVRYVVQARTIYARRTQYGVHPARLSSNSPQGLRLHIDTAATA